MKEKEKRFVASIYGAFWFCLGVLCVSEKFIYEPLQDPKKYDLNLLILGSIIITISMVMTIINIRKLIQIKSGVSSWFFLLSDYHFWCAYDNLFIIFFVNKSSFKLLDNFSFHFLIIYWHYRNWFMKNRVWF